MSYWAKQRVLITGGTGFLGHHIVNALKSVGATELTSVGSRDFDLTRQDQVEKMFQTNKPTVVFHLAGLVGGILANKERPADFFYQNLMMGTLVFHQAFKSGVKSLIAAGAGCGYPEQAPMPLKEDDLWAGAPQKESAPYSLAKRLLTIQSQAYHQQHGFKSMICIPGNIYGEFDNFDLQQSHVIPGLIRKFVEATQDKKSFVEVWGTGEPTRDFVYASDVARGMLQAAEHCNGSNVINLSSGQETSIHQVCQLLKDITRFPGEIRWNATKPSGQKRRQFDITRAKSVLGFTAPTTLEAGLQKTVNWFIENQKSGQVRL